MFLSNMWFQIRFVVTILPIYSLILKRLFNLWFFGHTFCLDFYFYCECTNSVTIFPCVSLHIVTVLCVALVADNVLSFNKTNQSHVHFVDHPIFRQVIFWSIHDTFFVSINSKSLAHLLWNWHEHFVDNMNATVYTCLFRCHPTFVTTSSIDIRY